MLTWSPRASMMNFLQPQAESGSSTRSSIFGPTQETKKGCQMTAGHTSSLWCDRICPSQLIGLKERTHLGTSSSRGSRLTISVRRTVLNGGNNDLFREKPYDHVWSSGVEVGCWSCWKRALPTHGGLQCFFNKKNILKKKHPFFEKR